MQSKRLADVLGDLIPLSPAERASLDRLQDRERPLRRGATLARENEGSSELFFLRRGTMMSYRLLDDGSRQILSFHFAGDLIGAAALAYRDSPETIVALTDCLACPIERGAYARVVVEHPRIGLAIAAIAQMERVALTDRLAGVGRTAARSRVAALLLAVYHRLRLLDRSVKDSFVPGLTQEEIGDATGLTSVHVNRMLRRLEEERLIARENGRVTLLDAEALAAAANHVNRHAPLDLHWVPPPG